MDRWRGKLAVVTGASMGIGAYIVQALVQAKVNVVGIARSADKLQDMESKLKSCPGRFYPMQCDVLKEEEILAAFETIEKNFGGIFIHVNNAAVVSNTPIIDSPTETYRKILDTNVLAAAICTREAVKSMRKHNIQGHIININSVAGHFADMIQIPLNMYCASKYAITGMTASLRNELNNANTSIKLTSISPGAVRTEMLIDVGIPRDVLRNMNILECKDIADAVIYVLGTPPNVVINELIITPINQANISRGEML